MSKKVVLVSTSASTLKDMPTGLWLEEMAAPYFIFKEEGYEVTIASTKGGPIPIDATSMNEPFFTDHSKKFMHDREAFGKFCHSTPLADIDFTKGDIDAIMFSGGHGTCVDFVDNADMKAAIETMFNSGKIVATVCHGVLSLVNCVKEDGSPLVKDKDVTGFSNGEEEAVQLTSFVPFLVEDKLKELGGKYSEGGMWASEVRVSGNLITGQNPQSSVAAAEAVVTALK